MNELEKIQRYIDETKIGHMSQMRYDMRSSEILAFLNHGKAGSGVFCESIALAFRYGRAKGYRAAKAEQRQLSREEERV